MKFASKQARNTRKASALKSLSTLALAVMGVFGAAASASAAPILGSALASFAVLGAAGVTNVATSTIGGNLGSAPLGSPIGDGSITEGYVFTAGSLQANTLLAQNAQTQLDAAILAVNAFLPDATITDGDLDAFQIAQGGVISPGTYAVASNTTNLVGDLVLDGGGSNSAVWAFQFSSSLITGTSSNVLVQHVGDGSNVGIYWTVGSAATLNGPTFAGNVLAHDLISSDGDLTLACGRLLSAETQVTLIHDTISGLCTGNVVTGSGGGLVANSGGFSGGSNVGGGTVPEPGSLALLGLGLAGLGFARRRHG